MSATVSILTACYNCESTIAKNIESSLKQTYDQKLIELIFIDDGSTDKTLSILEKYKKLYPSRIKMSSRENRGVCKTFQELIAQVNTDYFIFADADDYLSNTAIESLVYEAKKNNADISTGKTIGIKPNGKMHSLNYNNNFRNNMSASAFVLHNASYIWNLLIKTEFYKKCEYKWPEQGASSNILEDCAVSRWLFNCTQQLIGTTRKYTYYYTQQNANKFRSSGWHHTKTNQLIKSMDIFLKMSLINHQYSVSSKSTRAIIDDFIFFTAITIMSLVYINPLRFASEKPNKDQKKQYYIDFFNILKKYDIKLKTPKKSFWKKMAYISIWWNWKVRKGH